MNRHSHLIILMPIAAIAIAATSTPSFGESDRADLAGSSKGSVAAASPPGLSPFTSLITFISNGSVVESHRLFSGTYQATPI